MQIDNNKQSVNKIPPWKCYRLIFFFSILSGKCGIKMGLVKRLMWYNTYNKHTALNG